MNDLKFALRQLLKNPGFTSIAVLTMTLGIGANLGIFGVLNELLLRPRPVTAPDELWALTPADENGQGVYANVCRPYYEAVRQQKGPAKSLIGYAPINPKLRTVEGAERIHAEMVSPDYFAFLGIVPQLGRAFGANDVNVGDPIAVVSHPFWQSQYGGAKDIIGRTVTLNDQPMVIIGVTPPGFGGIGMAQPSVWLPDWMEKPLGEFTSYSLVARLDEPESAAALADSISPVVAEVTGQLAGFNDPQWSQYGFSPGFKRVGLQPIGRGLLTLMFGREQILGFLQFAAVATLLLLAIACANTAGLFVARALQRRRELATRLALGATRSKLVRQLVSEGMIISFAGTVGALLVFSWISSSVLKLGAFLRLPALTAAVDWRVVLFASVCAMAVGLVSSLFPALQSSRINLSRALKDHDAGGTPGRPRARLRHGLIVMQMAGSLVLLCGAVLCLRSLNSQLAVDVGFQPERLAIAPLNLERVGYSTNTAGASLAEIARQITLVPGVKAVGITRAEPFGGGRSSLGVPSLDGYRSLDGNPVMINFADIGPGMFASLGVPVLHGREMNFVDLELNRKVAVVNESFVQKYWPNTEPIGKQIQGLDVIGVVKDARFGRFDESPGPMMFRSVTREGLLHAKLLIMTAGDSGGFLRSIRAGLHDIHPRLIQGEVITIKDTMRNGLAVQGAALRILTVLGVLALGLAIIGTYGLVAYLVGSRTKEIGVRMAVGATRQDVLKLVLGGGLRLAAVSILVGVPVSLAAAVYLRHLLAGIEPFDPVSVAFVGGVILIVSLAACWLPARRASRVDPMVALRAE
jgi:predicted permease